MKQSSFVSHQPSLITFIYSISLEMVIPWTVEHLPLRFLSLCRAAKPMHKTESAEINLELLGVCVVPSCYTPREVACPSCLRGREGMLERARGEYMWYVLGEARVLCSER